MSLIPGAGLPQVVAGTRFSDPGAEVSDDVSGQVRDEDILAFGRAAVHTATPTLPSKPHVIIYAAQVSIGLIVQTSVTSSGTIADDSAASPSLLTGGLY